MAQACSLILKQSSKCLCLKSHLILIRKNLGSLSSKIYVSPYLTNRTVPAKTILQNLEACDVKRLELIKAEHNIFVANGKQVPLSLSEPELLELLCCTSSSGRAKYYAFRFKVNKIREKKLLKQEEKSKEPLRESFLEQKNQILRMIRNTPIKTHQDDWVAAEIRHPDSSQMIVFDCSHETEMRIADQKNLARQLVMLAANNRLMKPFPFHLALTSLQSGTNQYQFIKEAINGVDLASDQKYAVEDYLWTVADGHYQELQSSLLMDRRVIYLSPNAPRSFEPGEWDHNAVYIVGGIVDKAIRRPVTHARARRSGVECIRLPLERYLDWRSGNKTLTLVAIHGILATAKATNGDWKAALEKNIPARFMRQNDPLQREINRMLRSV